VNSPWPHERRNLPFVVVDDDGVIAPADQVDAIFRVRGHPGDIARARIQRKLLPALDYFVTQCAPWRHGEPPMSAAGFTTVFGGGPDYERKPECCQAIGVCPDGPDYASIGRFSDEDRFAVAVTMRMLEEL